MPAPSPAVRPSAGGIPRRAATAPSCAGGLASEKKRPKMTCTRNSVVTAADMEVIIVGGEVPSQDLLHKRLASELDAMHGLLKKAELISRCGACKGGAPAAGNSKMERFLALKQRPKPIEDGGNAPSVKRRKISTPVVVEQKFAEEMKDDKLADESKGDSDQIMGTSAPQPSEPASGTAQTTVQAESVPGENNIGGSAPLTAAVSESEVAQSDLVQDFQRFPSMSKPVFVRPLIDMPGLIYRAKLRRQQLEMERAALTDQS